MRLQYTAGDYIDFNADKSFTVSISHNSKGIDCSDGLRRFIDRGLTTYRSVIKITDTTANVAGIVAWLQAKTTAGYAITLTTAIGEEMFGPHYLTPSTFPVSCSIGQVSIINFVQSTVQITFTIVSADKSVLPATIDPSITATLSNLKFPTNYLTANIPQNVYVPVMQSEFRPNNAGYTSNVAEITFSLTSSELGEVLKFWELYRHDEFATPSLNAPIFTPSSSSSTLRSARIGDIVKTNRYLWDVPISFVIGSL